MQGGLTGQPMQTDDKNNHELWKHGGHTERMHGGRPSSSGPCYHMNVYPISDMAMVPALYYARATALTRCTGMCLACKLALNPPA